MEGVDVEAFQFAGDARTCRVADDAGGGQRVDQLLSFSCAPAKHAALVWHVACDEARVITVCFTAIEYSASFRITVQQTYLKTEKTTTTKQKLHNLLTTDQ